MKPASTRLCDYPSCSNAAVAEYEALDPPAGTLRFVSCDDPDHAPDVDPIAYLDERGEA